MQTQVAIDFQGMSARPDIHASIEQHVAALEDCCGRITGCKVMVKAPGGHHRTNGLYEIHVHLALPNGHQVNLTRTPPLDERYSDLVFAINDVFKHARRRLQDEVRRMLGQLKHHQRLR